MPKKRRNNGRNLSNKGRALPIHCNHCTRIVPKDKAVKRYVIKNLVDASSKRDIEEASAYGVENGAMPKLYMKNQWCVGCAIHSRVVKVRKTEDKRIRYVTKYRADQKHELTKLYRIAHQKVTNSNNPFDKINLDKEDDEEKEKKEKRI
jgi:small subunit ribosomal protein S26e